MKQPFTEVAKYLAKNKIKFYPIGRFLRYSHGKKVEKGIVEHLLETTLWDYEVAENHTIVVSKSSAKEFKKLVSRDVVINNGKVFSTSHSDDNDGKYVFVRKGERRSNDEFYIEIESPSGGWFLIVLLSPVDFSELERTVSAPLLKKTQKQMLAGQFF